MSHLKPIALSGRRCRWQPLAVVALLLIASQLRGQPITRFSGRTSFETQQAETAVALPKSLEELNGALARVEAQLGDVRRKLSPPGTTGPAAGTASGATSEELAEREQMLRQWVIALDQMGRHLRNLAEARRLNAERVAEQEAWRGFAQTPSVLVVEQLSDNLSAQRLQERTSQLRLSILEGEISRSSARLADSRKQLRLVKDAASRAGVQDSRGPWLIELAQLRSQVDDAAVESSQIGRLVTWESLAGLGRHLQFLERKLAAARALVRLTRADLDGWIARINEKRARLQKELNEAIAEDSHLRTARDAAIEQVRAAADESGTKGQAAAKVGQARVETSGRRIESLRGFLQLTDYAGTVWEDRLWATEQRSVRPLRDKQQHYEQFLGGLRQWKTMMEQSLATVSEQLLLQALKAEDTRLTPEERETERQIQAALQERAWVELRAVGALVFTEDLTTRLQTELSEQAARISVAGRLNAIRDDITACLRGIWNMELYIAEDSVIAGGQKVAIPRSITLGKVAMALSIFGAGLWTARWASRVVGRIRARWFSLKQRSPDVPAKAIAALVALISLLVAMASVRIPWTVFAFMGGALAIGVGFGAQTLINNFISGVILLCERSIRVGDIVEVDDQRGKVVRVGFRNSLIARGDGIEVLVPNSQFLEKKVVNWTLSNDRVRYAVSVGVAYGSALPRVTQLIAQAASEHPHLINDPAPTVLLEDFGDNALVFRLQFWMRLGSGVDGGNVRSELRHRIHSLFDDAGISIAFPQRDIRLDTNRPLEISVVNSSSPANTGLAVKGVAPLSRAD